MPENKWVITRRDFLRAGSCMAMGGIMGIPLMGSSPPAKGQRSRVVLIRDKAVINTRPMYGIIAV